MCIYLSINNLDKNCIILIATYNKLDVDTYSGLILCLNLSLLVRIITEFMIIYEKILFYKYKISIKGSQCNYYKIQNDF